MTRTEKQLYRQGNEAPLAQRLALRCSVKRLERDPSYGCTDARSPCWARLQFFASFPNC